MKTYEVFLKKNGKEPFEHAGSLDAPDDDLALMLARETHLRRAEGDRLWLVERGNVLELSPSLIAPNADKPHRHNDGKRVASHRKALRDDA